MRIFMVVTLMNVVACLPGVGAGEAERVAVTQQDAGNVVPAGSSSLQGSSSAPDGTSSVSVATSGESLAGSASESASGGVLTSSSVALDSSSLAPESSSVGNTSFGVSTGSGSSFGISGSSEPVSGPAASSSSLMGGSTSQAATSLLASSSRAPSSSAAVQSSSAQPVSSSGPACPTGYQGAGCLACAAGYQDNNLDGSCLPACSGAVCQNGTCDDSTGQTVCSCSAGYQGASCGECAADYQDRDLNGTCELSCSAAGLTCDTYASCMDDLGVATCVCNAGLQWDGWECIDLDKANWPMTPDHPTDYTVTTDTVLDNVTGLMWQRGWFENVAYGSVQEMEDHCGRLVLGGYDDWRLPKFIELYSLIDITTYSPAINTEAFPGTPGQFFAHSTVQDAPGGMYPAKLSFNTGETPGPSNRMEIRCVRAHSTPQLDQDVATGLNFGSVAVLGGHDAGGGSTWQQAVTACGGRTAGPGRHLATLKELVTLVDYRVVNPALLGASRCTTPGYCGLKVWSSTEASLGTANAWVVNFFDGRITRESVTMLHKFICVTSN